MASNARVSVPRATLKVSQVARRYNVHAETIRRAIRSGELPATRLGLRILRLARADVAEWARATTPAGGAVE